MKLLPILAISVFLLLLFGCGGQQPPANQTTPQQNTSNPANNTKPVTIIIGEQTNQTQEQNKTLEQNETPPVPVNLSVQYTYEPNDQIVIYFIDVGDVGLQGDAILVKKGDFNMLIDAGPAEKAGQVVDFLKSKGVENIAILVSTTADPRRYGGINAVADNFEIQKYWWSGNDFNDPAYAAIATRMANNSKGVEVVDEGYTASYDGINLTVLNPTGTGFSDVNNDAVVMRLDDRNFSMLFTSDIQTGGQGRLVDDEANLIKTRVMEAPYYGVGNGIAKIGIMLNAIKPETMIITGSADESPANGGSRLALWKLMNLSQYNITAYDNYDNGTLRMASDGQVYTIDALGS